MTIVGWKKKRQALKIFGKPKTLPSYRFSSNKSHGLLFNEMTMPGCFGIPLHRKIGKNQIESVHPQLTQQITETSRTEDQLDIIAPNECLQTIQLEISGKSGDRSDS